MNAAAVYFNEVFVHFVAPPDEELGEITARFECEFGFELVWCRDVAGGGCLELELDGATARHLQLCSAVLPGPMI